MELKALFGIISSLLVLIGGFPYLIDIHKNKVRPHILSWIGWAFITAIAASAMLASGSRWVVAILVANAVICLAIAAYAAIKKIGVWSSGIYDYAFFGLGIIGLALWLLLDMPVIAIVCAILADLCFGIPTIIKTIKDPSSETIFLWIAHALADAFALLAMQNLSFHESAYPVYLFLYDTFVLLIVTKYYITNKKPPS